jgi:hypothetical protein
LNSNDNSLLTITSVGDISFAGGFSNDPMRCESWVDGKVLDALKADVTIGNLECVFLPEGEEWPGKLCLAESADCVKALKHAGFTIVTLANNHILDYQQERGLLRTIEVLDKEGIAWCGAGRNLQEAQKPAITEAKGKRIAVFSRSYTGCNIKPKDNPASPSLAFFDINELKKSVRKARIEDNCDLIVLGIHWGLQNMHLHPPKIHDTALQILDNGIDLLLGHHSHVIQGLLQYNQKYVFFGQGNFYFFPFPYPVDPILPNGILYGPEAVTNRIAAVSRFSFDRGKWVADINMTRQNEEEKIVCLESPKAEQMLNKVINYWGNRNTLAFHLALRIMDICGIGRAIKRLIIQPTQARILWFLNPVNWFRLLWQVIVTPKHS